MWLNLDKDQLDRITKSLRAANVLGLHSDKDNRLADELDQKIAESFDQSRQAWVQKAFDLHEDEGTLEVDQQGDGSAMVSYSDDGGAYVMAWVWVSNGAMGIYGSDDAEDGDETCDNCGEDYPEGGDGFDGKCPTCADYEDQIENPDTYFGRDDWQTEVTAGNTQRGYDDWRAAQIEQAKNNLEQRKNGTT